MLNILIEDVKNTITTLLKLYHDYMGLNKEDTELAEEMEKFTKQMKTDSLRFQDIINQNPDAIAPHFRHVETLIKLAPALEACKKDHIDQISAGVPAVNILTTALNAIEATIKRGIENLEYEELNNFNIHTKQAAILLQNQFPKFEKAHHSLRLRFLTIKKELEVFED